MPVIISGLCVASLQEGHLGRAIFLEKGAQRAARLDVRPGMNDCKRKVTKLLYSVGRQSELPRNHD